MNPYNAAFKQITKKPSDPQKALRYLEKALVKGDPRAAYALGTWYLHGVHVSKNLKKGVSLFREAARHNLPDALYDLAVCYERGEGTKKSEIQAFRCYLRAALYGDSQAVYEVGRCYYYGIGIKRDRKLSDIWLERAESLGIKP